MNFLSQVRALPNPAYTDATRSHHPLTLHLTPTSTANITVTSLSPAPLSTQAFVKISPEAEVIVAPKARQSSAVGRRGDRESRSVASTSRRSAGGRSATSAARHRSVREDENTRPPVFLRALDRSVAEDSFEGEEEQLQDLGLRVWVDRDVLISTNLKGVTWAAVSIVRPAGLEEPQNPQTQTAEQDRPAAKVVARLVAWPDAVDSRHAVLSSLLCASLGAVGVVGGIVRIEAAPLQLPRTTSIMKQPSADGQREKDPVVRTIRIAPFIWTAPAQASSISFGGESKAEQERAVQRIKSVSYTHLTLPTIYSV